MDSPGIMEVAMLLGLQVGPRGYASPSVMVECPFCGKGAPRYLMSLSKEKNAYRCNRCGEHGGYLDLYGRVALGEGFRKGRGGNGRY